MSVRLRSIAVAAALAAGFTVTQAYAAKGDAARGESIAKPCAACHGPTGVSQSDDFPIIAGQPADYIAYALRSYRKGSKGDKTARTNPIMGGQATALKDEDILDLAAYFSKQQGLVKK